MSSEEDIFTVAAKYLAAADDPLADLIALASLETAARGRRRRRNMLLGAATSLLLVVTAWALLGGPQPGLDHDSEDKRFAWTRTFWTGPAPTTDETALLKRYLRDDASLVRRGAVLALAQHNEPVDPSLLEEIAFEMSETLSRPLFVASTGRGELASEMLERREMTLRAVLTSIWYHAAREGSYPRPETIEALLSHEDDEIRSLCCRVLGEVKAYTLPAALRSRLLADTEKVRRAARKLLKRENE